MNLFIVDFDPIVAGTVLPDRLGTKMVLELAQMLSTACRVHGVDDNNLYKVAHINHPCSKWVRETQDNFLWAYEHGIALAEEYTRRYGKFHKSQTVIELAGNYFDKIPFGAMTRFIQAMPFEYQHTTDPTIAYKKYITTKPYWQNRPYRKGRDFSSFFTQ